MQQDGDTKDAAAAAAGGRGGDVGAPRQPGSDEDAQTTSPGGSLGAFARVLDAESDAGAESDFDALLARAAAATGRTDGVPSDTSANTPSVGPAAPGGEPEGIEELERVAAQAFRAPAAVAATVPGAMSLGELRAQACLTLEEVAEETGLFPETIDALEEDVPVVDTPPSLLQAFGALFGYSAQQIDAVLRLQGGRGVAMAAYKLQKGAAPPGTPPGGVTSPRTFAEILDETGATPEQQARWLDGGGGGGPSAATGAAGVSADDVLETEGDLFA